MADTLQPRVAFDAALLREPYSGVEVMIHETACALAAHGTLPYVVYAPASGVRPLPASDRVQVHAVTPVRARLRRILWEQCVLPRLLRRDGAQVLHAPAYVAPLRAQIPVVLTAHDLHVFTHPQYCSFANRLHYRLLLPLSIRRAAAITVYSEHVRRALVARFPTAAAKTHVIPPGLPAPFLHPVPDTQRDAARNRLRLPEKFLLFVGDLAPRKNLPGLQAAFALLRAEDRLLHLVMAGAPGGGTGLQATDDHRHCLGYVPDEDLPALYTLAQALVFPSFDEGFGLPALEAMACGCPVVCSPGGSAEVCGDAAVVCDPAFPTSIAGAARALLRDPALRRVKVAAGLRRAAQFRWENTIETLEAVYRDVFRLARRRDFWGD